MCIALDWYISKICITETLRTFECIEFMEELTKCSMCMCMNPQNYVANLWRFLTLIHFWHKNKKKTLQQIT